MSGRILFMIIIFSFFGIIDDIFKIWLRKREGKKVNYDCSKCSAWDCPGYDCIKHRGE